MDDKIVFEAYLDPRINKRTGKTKHVDLAKERVLMELPVKLIMVLFSGAKGYNLIHLNEAGEELADTYHKTVEGAMDQADFEYLVQRDQWQQIDKVYP